MSKPLIFSDTREGKPWYFEEDDYFRGTARQKVDYGDYTIEGLEHLIFLERKANCMELANNITEKRFDRLLDMGKTFKYKYIIVEASFESLINFPKYENVSPDIKKKIKISAPFLISNITRMMVDYNIHVIFAGDVKSAKIAAHSVLKHIIKKENATSAKS